MSPSLFTEKPSSAAIVSIARMSTHRCTSLSKLLGGLFGPRKG